MPTAPSSTFLDVIPRARDTNELVHFVSVHSIRTAIASSYENARLLHGRMNLSVTEKKIEVPWLWEATGHPLQNGYYHWDTIVLHTDGETNGLFDEDRLNAVAVKARTGKGLLPIEQIALFMVGCLVHFANTNKQLMKSGMELAEAKPSIYAYRQCDTCMLPVPPL